MSLQDGIFGLIVIVQSTYVRHPSPGFRIIRFVLITDRYFTTPMTTTLALDQGYNDFIIQRTPAGRDFVSGVSIVVDGGMLGST